MLPPIAPSVLESNPKFKALYTNLAGSRLNADASTRLIKQQRAQADVEKQLLAARKEAAQRVLLQNSLQAVASRIYDLPPELIETCHIVSAQLSGELSQSDLDILADDIDFFVVNIPLVAAAISKHLQETGRVISNLASAASNSPKAASSDDISSLAAQASSLQESISTQSTSISLTRTRVTELSEALLGTYASLFETSIRILEQVHHGSISRGSRARAEHLAVVAKGLELKLQILAQTDSSLTDPALQTELERYRERLEGKAEELSGRIGVAERALGEYGRAGKGMSEIARRFAEVRGECEGVREEIARLEARRSDVD